VYYFRYIKDSFFASKLEDLVSTSNKKEFRDKANKLINYAIKKDNITIVYRLSIELDYLDYKATKLENYIIKSGDSKYILKYAREIKTANIKKLERAIIDNNDVVRISIFGCFVMGANKEKIEDIIASSNNAKAAYYWVKFNRFANVNKVKHIIISSKRPRYLFAMARSQSRTHAHTRAYKEDFKLIQDLIIAGKSNLYIRMFAQLKGADIARLERKIIDTGSKDEMLKFSRAVNSPKIMKLLLLF
jgi:hypothetical protein